MSNNQAVMGNFTDVNALIHAAEKIRDSGYKEFDIFTPYPVHGLDKAMGVQKTILPYVSFGAGVTGLISAIGLMYWTGAVDYKLSIGGKPFFSAFFGLPIMFELTILFTALATFGGLWFLCGLPKWYNDYQHDEGFRRAQDDIFVVSIFSNDKRFSLESAKNLLSELHADDVRVVEAQG